MQRKCTPWYGAKLRALGAKKGVVDLLLPYPSKGWPGLWCELKVNDNKLQSEQSKWLKLMERAGYATAVVYNDWELVRDIILEYLGESNGTHLKETKGIFRQTR